MSIPEINIWSNKFLKLYADIKGEDIVTGSNKLYVVLTGLEKPLGIGFFESGYSIIENNNNLNSFIVNEHNLCNVTLMELFNGFVYNSSEPNRIKMNEETARYLIDTSGAGDEYVWYEDYLYNVRANRALYISKLESYNDKISSKDAIRANRCLLDIIEESGDENADLIGCDLRFVGVRSGKSYNERDIVLPDAVAHYTCGRRKVAGIIKHTYNKLNKNERESYGYKLRILYASLKDSNIQYDVNIFDDHIEIFTQTLYTISMLSNDNVSISWEDKNHKRCSIDNIKPSSRAIISLINANERNS